MKPSFSIILAASKNGIIGNAGAMPWNLPSDLRRFKQLTQGKPVIMGRKTWESLPSPLKGRVNIVVSRQPYESYDFNEQTPIIFSLSLEQAIARARVEAHMLGVEEIFFIGGAQIYKQAAPYVDKLYVTIVLAYLSGDTMLACRDFAGKWRLMSRQLMRKQSVESHNSVFYIYEREA